MTTIHRDIQVGADPERCFDLISDPTKAPLFLNHLTRIDPIEVEPRGIGNRWMFEYDLFGVPLTGESHCTVFEQPASYAWSTLSGGIPATFSFRFAPEEGGTAISLDVDYEVPTDVLSRLADGLAIERMNESEADAAADNLRTILEDD